MQLCISAFMIAHDEIICFSLLALQGIYACIDRKSTPRGRQNDRDRTGERQRQKGEDGDEERKPLDYLTEYQ